MSKTIRDVCLCTGVVAAVLVATRGLGAQQTPVSPESVAFEAASVKPNKSGTPEQFVRRQPGGRFTSTNMPIRALITFAYQLQPMQLVGGPG